MSSSYLPAGVKVNCTFMTNGMPNELGISRSVFTVFTKDNTPLLNVDDKKISATFKCKAQQEFWTGLAALCAGIAVAALAAAAVVATGGAALLVIAAVAAVASAGCLITLGIYNQKHPCDCTLQASSQWKLYHKTVRINGASAILQQSYLHCAKGGIVQPFLNTHIALEAASKFTKQNNEQIGIHMGAEFLQGIVTVAAGMGDPVGTVLSVGLTVGEYIAPDISDKATYGVTPGSTGDIVETGVRDNIGGNALSAGQQLSKKGLADAMISDLTKQGMSTGDAEAWEESFGYTLKDLGNSDVRGLLLKQMVKKPSFGVGIAGAAVNIGLSVVDSKWTDNIAKDVEKERYEYASKDSKDNVGIIANNP